VITVTLEDSRIVVALSQSRNAPTAGGTIRLRERTFESGRTDYVWLE
jgi:hypothetical protein